MEKFLIEVAHGEDKGSCMQAIQVFLRSGSHFVTHADWGVKDGAYKAWLVAETENTKEAMQILPSAYRQSAKITLIQKFARTSSDDHLTDLH